MQGRPFAIVQGVLTLICAIAFANRPLQAADPQDFAVEVTAQVQVSPSQIHLQWPLGSFATGYTVSRKLRDDQAWSLLANLPGSATGFADNDVVLGAAYEYEIAQQNSDGLLAYGYIYAAIELSCPGDRGRLVLVVDDTFSADLQTELSTLQSDLVGDGWTVLRHDVDRASAPGDVKSLIQQDYAADPANTKAVFLLGHVPVPYSGDIDPDQHPSHQGAWPADVFYADMSGTWTDVSVNDTSSEDPRNHNVPGDGKFDQSDTPGTAILEVGRVDFSDLPTFPQTELDLLRRYLNKNHAFRHKLFQVGAQGLIRDNFGEIDGDAPATDAWRSFTAFFGLTGINAVGPDEFFPTLATQSYLWAYGGGGGEYYQADTVGSTSDFANQSPQCVFYMMDGSYFGDWDSPDNLLRAALATPGYGLAAAWTGLPHWFLHHMALGEPIGFSTLVAQNNRGLYKNQVNFSPGEVHIALLGDPTLRMHVTAPPANLNASFLNGSVIMNWSPSSDPVYGYYVYRAQTSSGPFSRLTRDFVTSTSFTDNDPPAGTNTYMLRAIKLETSASGSYFNPSQGIFVTLESGTVADLPSVNIDAPSPTANDAGPVDGAFAISSAAPVATPLTVTFTIGGTATNGTDYESISNSVVLTPSSSMAWVTIHPLNNETGGSKTVTLTLASTTSYLIGPSNTATVTIQDTSSTNQPPSVIEAIFRQTNGALAIQLQGNAGRAYTMESSTNLTTWSTVGTGVVATNSLSMFIDHETSDKCRFYRARWQ